jgi:hypothetical protein
LLRIRKDKHLTDDMQVGVMVIRRDGVWAARGLRPGFQFAAASKKMGGVNTLYDANFNSFTPAT